MINKLSFSNFKSWQNLPDMNFSKLTGIFGTNSSGKTSIIQLLLLLKQTVESSDRASVLNFGTEKDYIQLGSYDDIVYNHDSTEEIKFFIDWKLKEKYAVLDVKKRKKILFEDDKLLFSGQINQTKNKRIYMQEFSYEFSRRKYFMKKTEIDQYAYRLSAENIADNKKIKLKRTPGRVWDLPEPTKFYGFQDQIRTYYQDVGFLFDLQLKLEELFNNLYYLGPLRENPQRQYPWTGSQPKDMGIKGEKAIEALLVSRQRGAYISRGQGSKKMTVEEYVAHWLKQLGLIHSFKIEELAPGTNLYRVLVKQTPTSPSVLITDVGFGVSQVLPVITLCYYAPEGATLLIEQPEIHLHPKVQAKLADVLIDAIKVRKIQVILESHSEHLLKRLQRRIAEDELSTEEMRLYFCSKNNEHSTILPLLMNIFGEIENWPEDFFGDDLTELLAINKAARKKRK